MRHKRIKNLIVGGALIGAFFITKASAYDQPHTHPALTDEIVDFYNLNFSQKLNNQDKTWIIQGSMDEDQGMRPMNHFYDPVHNIGMAGFPTSKQWAMSSGAQSNLAMSNNSIAQSAGVIKSPDDFSYERAMNDYAQGDRQRAMLAFGHLLHLLEDMGVPDHTRNDPHPPVGTFGSPYEHEMAKWSPDNFNVASKFKKEGLKPVILANLGEYFDKIAKYSNGNFFSKDTINDSNYANPTIDFWIYKKNQKGEEDLVGYKKDKSGNYVLVKNIIKTGELTISSEDILDGYWDRLSREVVLNGSGALNLFLTEAEKAKQEYANKPLEKNWFARLLGLIGISTDNDIVDNSNDGDNMVTPTPKVTNQVVSPSPLVTKTPVTSVTIVSPLVSPILSPSKTPAPTPKLSTTPTPSPIPKLSTAKKFGTVVINEIAWAGTDASATDEWIELYNTENNPIDISSWRLVSSDDSPDIIFSEGTIIQANSYFLIERTDDNTVSDITADLAAGFGQGGLNNAGEMIRLFDSIGIVVDVVGGTGEAWYFGDSTSKNSMERIDSMKAGNSASNWKSFSGTSTNKDATGGLINGTPKAKNSTAVQVIVSYGGGGGGSSSTPDSTSSPQATPTPTPSQSPSPSPIPSPEPDGDTANLGDIVLNEIAWMGTSASLSNDEWIELRNITNKTINLNNWNLKSKDGTPDITLIGNISPFGFYVLERTDDQTLPDIDADQIYTGALGNTGENLVLKDISGTVIDQVDGSNAWKINGNDEIIGNNDTKKTAQRMDGGWITATSTPKSQNSADVITQAPSAVTNLLATINSPLTISWSAPDPGGYSPASLSYDLRYSLTGFPSSASWDLAIKVASSSLPSVGNEGESQIVTPDIAHDYGQTLYFALKTKVINIPTCEVGNGETVDKCSDISNIAEVSFPSAIDDGAWSMLGKDQYHTSFAASLAGPGVGATISWEFDAGAGNTVGQPVVSADGGIYFGSANGSGKLIKLDKNGVQKWEYATNVSIGTPAILSDGVVYFGRIGAGGVLAFTALNSDGTKKWDYDDASTIKAFTVSEKGEPYFTYSSGNDKLVVLNTGGSTKTQASNPGLSGFVPIVLENGDSVVARRISGNQFFTKYLSDGSKIWDLAYTGANGSMQSNPSHDKSTGKTYSAIGYDGGSSFGFRMFVIPPDGSVLNTTVIEPASNGSGATMVSITPTNLLVGLDYSWSNPASGSKLFSLNKSDLTVSWSFQAEGKINQQIAVDKDGGAYFSTQSGDVYGVDKDGNERWHISTGVSSVISPVLSENRVIWGYGSKVMSIK